MDMRYSKFLYFNGGGNVPELSSLYQKPQMVEHEEVVCQSVMGILLLFFFIDFFIH